MTIPENEAEWRQQFRPLNNPLSEAAGDGPEIVFYGEEEQDVEFVANQPETNVWTEHYSFSREQSYLLNGYFEGSDYYRVTEVPWEVGTEYEIPLDD